MKLQQKKFLRPEFRFELKDQNLVVSTVGITASSSCELPLKDLSTNLSYHRYVPVGWYLFGGAAALSTFMLAMSLFAPGSFDEKVGLGVLFVMCSTVAMVTLYEAHKRNADYVIVHWEASGNMAACLRAKNPTERHVSEFLDILKEAIERSRNASRASDRDRLDPH